MLGANWTKKGNICYLELIFEDSLDLDLKFQYLVYTRLKRAILIIYMLSDVKFDGDSIFDHETLIAAHLKL